MGFFSYLLKKRLLNANPDDIPNFSFNGYNTYARVVRVYDGDTITILFQYHKRIYKYSCRIYGIDTPEIRTRNEEEKIKGYEARDFLSSYILEQIIKVHFLDFDKYGRPLVNLYIKINGDYIDIAKLMISQGYAKPYFGGTK